MTDPELRAKLTPSYPVGCKRPLQSRAWFPTFALPNVRLETSPIVEFTERGLRTADGAEHEVDTVIYGTGFHAADYLRSLDVHGTNGRRLRDDWRDGAEAYLGTVVPGYPNLFTLYGPNTNGVTSIIYILEAQAEFVRRLLDDMARQRVQAVEVRRDVHDAYNDEIQRAMQDTVWLANCNNYYRHPNGKVVTQFPYSGTKFVDMLAEVETTGRIRPEGSTRVIGIHHTAIVTADVERSMRFWCDGLGFAELFDHTFTGDWPTLFGATTDRLRSVFLGDPNAPDTGIVELVQFEDADTRSAAVVGAGIRLLPVVASARCRRDTRRAGRAWLRRRRAPHRDARAGRQDGCHGGDHRAGWCARRADRSARVIAVVTGGGSGIGSAVTDRLRNGGRRRRGVGPRAAAISIATSVIPLRFLPRSTKRSPTTGHPTDSSPAQASGRRGCCSSRRPPTGSASSTPT